MPQPTATLELSDLICTECHGVLIMMYPEGRAPLDTHERRLALLGLLCSPCLRNIASSLIDATAEDLAETP